MTSGKSFFARSLSRLLWPWEKLNSWAFGTDFNPTYQSGVLAVFLLVVVGVTGLPLLFFYRVGSPYESMQTVQNQPVLAWLRALHRYASDAAVVAVLWHILRMLLGGRTAGQRRRAWLSGIVLTALMIFIGGVGLVMVWDQPAQRLAAGAIRFLEGLPLFSEPPARIFAANSSVGDSFFFMLIFLHVALPLLLTFLLLFHTSRVARARLWPEPHLVRFWLLALGLLALVWPVALAPAADLLGLPGRAPLDVWYAWWLPLVEWLGPAPTAAWLGAASLALASVPWWWAPLPPPSQVDTNQCTGCTQCYQDCPYDAIAMVKRSPADPRHSEWVAQVDGDLCVSCGICAGSCAPMGVGPPARSGRDQLREVEGWAVSRRWLPGDVAVLACRWGTGEWPHWAENAGIHCWPTGCSGSLHTSVVELLLRKGAAGVMVVSCPERDCSHREGPKWLRLRVYEDREAELQARVDRRRVRLVAVPSVDVARALQEALAFRQELLALGEANIEGPSAGICRAAG